MHSCLGHTSDSTVRSSPAVPSATKSKTLTPSRDQVSIAPTSQSFAAAPDSPAMSTDVESESEDEAALSRDGEAAALAREQERRRVLEAAGLVVQQAPAEGARRRRPPPPRPRPVSTASEADLRPAPSLSLSFATAAEEVSGTDAKSESPDFTAEDAYAQWQKLQREAGTATKQTDQQNLQAALTSLNLGDMRKTWSSLVESGTLETIPDQERKRQEAIFELIKTESGYLETLQLVVQEYYSKAQSVLEDRTVEVIFANIEDILLWSVVRVRNS